MALAPWTLTSLKRKCAPPFEELAALLLGGDVISANGGWPLVVSDSPCPVGLRRRGGGRRIRRRPASLCQLQ